MSIKELVELHNEYADKPVKRFADKTTAVMPKANRSDAIAISWNDPETNRKRRQRSAVLVNGTEFPSVRQAFIECGLDLKSHIKFRMQIKEATELNEFGLHWEIIPLNYKAV